MISSQVCVSTHYKSDTMLGHSSTHSDRCYTVAQRIMGGNENIDVRRSRARGSVAHRSDAYCQEGKVLVLHSPCAELVLIQRAQF